MSGALNGKTSRGGHGVRPSKLEFPARRWKLGGTLLALVYFRIEPLETLAETKRHQEFGLICLIYLFNLYLGFFALEKSQSGWGSAGNNAGPTLRGSEAGGFPTLGSSRWSTRVYLCRWVCDLSGNESDHGPPGPRSRT